MIGFCSIYHEQNGFYHSTEWIPVISSALAVAALIPVYFLRISPGFLTNIRVVMGLQILTGLLGAGFHLYAIITGPSLHFTRNFVYGAPPFAPMLFADFALLAFLGLYQLKCVGEFENTEVALEI